ncbi:uncharacterized protein LOC111696049 [Eurytemora carolleeae]|uniref:uncharacterized protein LOC111696049 n=1 Tax=Eurytemora carolleeae TaxID=1294199 RepID=UPI000C75BCD6|nr:uncharacterized protein LOC111696049 [Eurytemora carolleeae]|eukprot:XP_023321340.1 uncharacterized protein LOC111696049 [Eurytemora affinis]
MKEEETEPEIWTLLDAEHLEQMRLMISGDESGIESTQPDSVFSSSMGVDKVSKPEFSLICCNLLGHERFVEAAERMFDLVAKGGQFITWPNLLDFFIGKEKEAERNKNIFPMVHDGDFKACQHSRRETIVKMIPVSTGSSFVYIIISKFGHVGIYDDKLRLQRKYEIDIDTDPDSDLDVGASDPGWITDAIWMNNSKHMVYTSSLRTIHFFDASASVHYEEYRGFGLKNIPTCLDFWYDPEKEDGPSLLMFGDDGGGLSIIRFSQPPNSLFKKDEVDSVQTLFWQRMEKHTEYATIHYTQGVHGDAVSGIRYLSENRKIKLFTRFFTKNPLVLVL